jgi:hypothetical protein
MSNKAVRPEALLAATASATARRCAEHEYVYVPVDGSSLVLTDRAKNKPLGSIGKRSFPTRGLKAVNAVAGGSRREARGRAGREVLGARNEEVEAEPLPSSAKPKHGDASLDCCREERQQGAQG